MTSLTSAPGKLWAFRAGAVGAGLLFGLILAEVSLRLAGIQPPQFVTKRQLVNETPSPPIGYHCYPDNPSGELMPVPDVSHGRWKLEDYSFERERLPLSRLAETPWCVEYRYSTRGLRDREYEEPPPPGIARLAVVGDSFVLGEGVPETLTLPRQLQQRLGSSVECVNAGQVGADIDDEAAILEAVVPGARCDAALLVLIANDIRLTQPLARRQDYINDLIVVRDTYLKRHRGWSFGSSRFWDVARTPWQMRSIREKTIRWYLDSYDPRHNGVNMDRLREQLRTVKQKCPVPMAVVLYPLLEGLEGHYPLQPIHAVLRRLAEEAGLPVYDLADDFRGHVTEQLWVHPSDRHPNGRAHRIAADALAAWLRQSHPDWLQPRRLESQGTP